MPYVSLALYGVFLLLAFGLRTIVHYRQTGSTGLRLPPPGTATVERLGTALFLLALLLAAVAPLLALTGTLEPISVLRSAPFKILGFLLYGLGLCGTLWAQFAMGRSWRIGVDVTERTMLVTRGPFAVVRNPIFSAMFLAAAGLALLVPNALALAAFAILILGVELQVRFVEEPYLLQTHGAAYATYAAHTGRFAPGLGQSLRSPGRY